MSRQEYSEKLKDPRWQKKRLKILERDLWTCKRCGSTKNTLNVHHIVYLKGIEPWEIPDGFLITLCEKCHEIGSHEIIILVSDVLNYLWEIPDGINHIRDLFKIPTLSERKRKSNK